jgi:hypothetical protein
MFPINLDDARLSHFASTINCQKGNFPFTYLGLPLGITKPNLEYFLPMVVRVEKRLCGIADFLDYGGKLLMVKSVLSSLPIYYMSCLDIPVTINEQIIEYMRHCLWRKKYSDVQAKGSALVAWKKICRPKNQGGLGVLDLGIQNKAILLKNLHQFYNKLDIPWVQLIWNSYYSDGNIPGNQLVGSFCWKSHLKLVDLFKAMARCNVGDGKSDYFWTDLWQSSCLQQKFPHLLSFSKCTNGTISEIVNYEYMEDLFHLPLSHQAFLELNQ